MHEDARRGAEVNMHEDVRRGAEVSMHQDVRRGDALRGDARRGARSGRSSDSEVPGVERVGDVV